MSAPVAPLGSSPEATEASSLASLVAATGIRRIHVLGWRDLADAEAGGSELHLHEIARRWAAAGLDITVRTSAAVGRPAEEWRAGYRVVRRGGRLAVFPRAVAAELAGRHGPRDALVEIWNGAPWWSPLWCRGPLVVWLHHVHGPMWDQTLGPVAGPVGRFVETAVAPRWYRRARIVTLAESSRRELVDDLGFPADRVSVVPPGVDARFVPDPAVVPDAEAPLLVAVGRLVPVKRFDLLVRAMADVHRDVPSARLVIVGEGYERPRLEAAVAAHRLQGVVRLAGQVGDDALLGLYRRATLVVSTSLAEGWGMTLTEAAACGTPAVVTDIVGHRDAVEHQIGGLCVGDDDIAAAVVRVLRDPGLRARLAEGAAARARRLSWDRTAAASFELLAEEVARWRSA